MTKPTRSVFRYFVYFTEEMYDGPFSTKTEAISIGNAAEKTYHRTPTIIKDKISVLNNKVYMGSKKSFLANMRRKKRAAREKNARARKTL